MDDKPLDKTGLLQKKKSDTEKEAIEAPTRVQKEQTAEQGAFQKLHQASIFSGLSELSGKASEQLARAKNDVILSVAGFKASDIVNKLPPDVLESLARGKQLHDTAAANPAMKLSKSEEEMVAKYNQYHDRIVNDGLNQNSASAMLIDHKAMIDELNESIAARYQSEKSAQHHGGSEDRGSDTKTKAHSEESRTNLRAEEATSVRDGSNSESAHVSKNDSLADFRSSHGTVVKTDSGAETKAESNVGSRLKPENETRSARDSNARVSTNTSPEIAGGTERRSDRKFGAKIDGMTDVQPETKQENKAGIKVDHPSKEAVIIESTRNPAQASLSQEMKDKNSSGFSTKQPPLSSSAPSNIFESHIASVKNQPNGSLPEFVAKTLTESRFNREKINDSTGKVQPPEAKLSKSESLSASRSESVAARFEADRKKAQDNPIYNEGNKNFRRAGANSWTLNTEPVKVAPNETVTHVHAIQATSNTTSRASQSELRQSAERPGSGSESSFLSVISGGRLPQSERSVLKIDDAQRLTQSLKGGAFYMVRPIAFEAKFNETSYKILLPLHSSLMITPRLSPNSDAHYRDISSKSGARSEKSSPSFVHSELTGRIVRPATFTIVKSIGSDSPRPTGIRASLRSSGAENIREGEGKRLLPLSPRALSEPRRHVLGAEIALTMILASAGIQRIRAEQVKPVPSNSDKNSDQDQKSALSGRSEEPRTARELVIERLRSNKVNTKIEMNIKIETNTIRIPTARNIDRHSWFVLENSRNPLKIQANLVTKAISSDSHSAVASAKNGSDSRYTFGTEIALAALFASGGLSRQKVDRLPKAHDPMTAVNPNLIDRQACEKKAPEDESRSAGGSTNPTRQEVRATNSSDEPVGKQTALSRMKESFIGPESLKKQLDALLKRLALKPVPVYAVATGEHPNPERLTSSNSHIHFSHNEQENTASDEPSDDTKTSAEQIKILEQNAKPKEINQFQPQRPTVLVALDDTLISLAETFFHDPNLGWLIAALNARNTKQVELDGRLIVTLTTRQRLILPLFKPDVVDFYAGFTGKRPIEELVTIVEETQVDRELMSVMLGSVVGDTRRKEGQKKKQFDTKTARDFDGMQLDFED